MTDKKVGVGRRMAAIAELAKEDLLLTSDEAILAEAVEDGVDPASKAAELRVSALAKIRLAKRERLARARESYGRAGTVANASKSRPSIEEIKRLVQRVIQNGAANGLAVAFRKGEKLSNSDWEGLWDDMTEMGLIDDGKPRV